MFLFAFVFIVPLHSIHYVYSLAQVWQRRYKEEYRDTHLLFIDRLFQRILRRPNYNKIKISDEKVEKLHHIYVSKM